jgi:hypothetical protein
VKRPRALARRNIHERLVIACLRGERLSQLRTIKDAPAAFAHLASVARASGMTLFAGHSPFVSDGEIALLTQIATAQRQEGSRRLRDDAPMAIAIMRCCAVLHDAGIWLSHNILAAVEDDSAYILPRETPRTRALSLAQSCGTTSTEQFLAAGISRQYVSRLCRDGYLQRIRHGWYRAAPAPPGSAFHA